MSEGQIRIAVVLIYVSESETQGSEVSVMTGSKTLPEQRETETNRNETLFISSYIVHYTY